MPRQLTCDAPDTFPWSCHERQVQTLVYGEKKVPIKVFEIERKLISSFRTQWIEQRFTMVIGFNEVFNLFFTKKFEHHFYAQIFRKSAGVVHSAKIDVIRKVIGDFDNGLHSREFTVLQTGMKLRADIIQPNEKWFPMETFDLLIQGTFEF